MNIDMPRASAKALARARAAAFATLTPSTAATTHLSVATTAYPKGHTLRLVDREIVVPAASVLVFEDLMPGANFGHPCRYRFHSAKDGAVIEVVDAMFPPEVADPGIELEHFHAPLLETVRRPVVYQQIDWTRLHLPWWRDDNRFALLFTSQISNRRHVEDLEFAYRILRNKLGFPADHIYVLCYDGTIGATDASGTGMSTWVGDGTAYQMQVNDSATKAHLQDTLTAISDRMDDDSLLFVHTNNHGATSGLCVDNSTVVTPDEWGTMLDGMRSFGTLVVTMEQCYSGAFLQPTLGHSTAARTSFAAAVPADKVSAGATHFDPWALAWFEGLNDASAYGASLAHHADVDHSGRISMVEAFNYSDQYDTDTTYDDPVYGDKPFACGASIYLNRVPSWWEVLRELIERYRLIEEQFPHIPGPDPQPDWAAELMAHLEVADQLAQRVEAVVAAADTKAPRRTAGRA